MNKKPYNNHPINLDINSSLVGKSQNFNVILNEMLEKEKTEELSIISKKSLDVKPSLIAKTQTYLKINKNEIILTEKKRDGKHITKIDLEEMTFYQHTPGMKEDEFVEKDNSFVDEFQLLVNTIVEKVDNGDYILMRKE